MNKVFKISLIIVCCFFATQSAFGQFSLEKSTNTSFEELLNPRMFIKIDQEFSLLSYIKPEHSYSPTLGAFCILENKIAKETQLPVKMRLGSVDYVDKLENKGK